MKHDYPRADHPSFGMIGVSRASAGGNGLTLFGSSTRHHTVLSVTIRKAFSQRDLTDDRVHSTGDVLIEVEMSEAQFGRLLTQPNIGDGVPCTIRYLPKEFDVERDEHYHIPRPPLPPRTTDKFRTDMAQRTTRAMSTVRSLQREIGAAMHDGALRKGRGEELLRRVESIKTELQSNIPWVTERFEEDMEKTVDEAKADLAAYVDRIAARVGISSNYLSDGPEQPPLTLAAERNADELSANN
jgi:hypothetical protein